MEPLPLALLLLLCAFVACVVHVHLRGRVRLKLPRQLTDHSTFVAPYNVLVYASSAVPNRPLVDREGFPELDLLREHWREIRDEAAALLAAGRVQAADSYNDLAFQSFFHRGWRRFYLKWYGRWLPSARTTCPRTIELLKQVPQVHAAMFALLPGGSRLGKHRDPFAGSLRYHLGLITPNSPQCRIWVDGEECVWHDGEDLLFDETFVHWAKNETDQNRLILFCDVERPLRGRIMRAINRFVIRWILPRTQTRNERGETVGLFNRLFEVLHRARLPFRRLKKANRRLYYGLKYASYVLIAWLLGRALGLV